MKFLTADYWKQGGNNSALLLQQCSCRQIPVLFACLCTGEDCRTGGYLSERLLQWFREKSIRNLTRRPEREIARAMEELPEVLTRASIELAPAGRELARADERSVQEGRELMQAGKKALKAGEESALGSCGDFAGIFCVGEQVCLFYRGEQGIYLANTGFGRPHIKRLSEHSERLGMEWGQLQPGTGLLLGTKDFCRELPETVLKEALWVRETERQEQVERHMGELGREAERRGGRNLGAVLVRVQQ